MEASNGLVASLKKTGMSESYNDEKFRELMYCNCTEPIRVPKESKSSCRFLKEPPSTLGFLTGTHKSTAGHGGDTAVKASGKISHLRVPGGTLLLQI